MIKPTKTSHNKRKLPNIVFQGSPIECDGHKYDPIETEEYFVTTLKAPINRQVRHFFGLVTLTLE